MTIAQRKAENGQGEMAGTGDKTARQNCLSYIVVKQVSKAEIEMHDSVFAGNMVESGWLIATLFKGSRFEFCRP